MKSIILCILFVTVCLFVDVQGTCSMGNRQLTVGDNYIDCIHYKCHPDGTLTALACPAYMCAPGKEIGYRETDYSKPYPECCEGPICAEN